MNNSLKKLVHLFFVGVLMIVVVTWLTGCSEDEKNEPATIKLSQNADFGDILTDDKGQTLYFYSRDSKGSPSACTGGCLNKWPIFNIEKIVLPAGSALLLGDFATIGDGVTKQVTYKGWPLYYYAPNSDGVLEEVGKTSGDNVSNVWFVAKPDYTLMIANAQLVGLDGKNYTSAAYAEASGNSFYFTDASGSTLYIFKADKKNTNTFTLSGLTNNANWPIFHTELTKFPTGVLASDFGTITVQGSAKQLTYKGWPLYYYGEDDVRGDNKGVSVPTPGKWPIVYTNTVAAPN